MAQNFRLFPSGMVRLGSSVLRDVTPRYLGITTTASCPSCRTNFGSAPTTSASPPVLAKGTASEATYSTRMRDRTDYFPPKATREGIQIDFPLLQKQHILPRPR